MPCPNVTHILFTQVAHKHNEVQIEGKKAKQFAPSVEQRGKLAHFKNNVSKRIIRHFMFNFTTITIVTHFKIILVKTLLNGHTTKKFPAFLWSLVNIF